MYNTEAFPGIGDVLMALHARGVQLAVATSKPEHYAIPIIEFLEFSPYFATVGGDELDGSLRTKALVIDKVLTRLRRPDPSRVVMVGDRSHDVDGAREHGIDTIAVRWGYSVPGELEAAAPAAICADADELARLFGLEVRDAAAS